MILNPELKKGDMIYFLYCRSVDKDLERRVVRVSSFMSKRQLVTVETIHNSNMNGVPRVSHLIPKNIEKNEMPMFPKCDIFAKLSDIVFKKKRITRELNNLNILLPEDSILILRN